MNRRLCASLDAEAGAWFPFSKENDYRVHEAANKDKKDVKIKLTFLNAKKIKRCINLMH
jgi:hypothetical protein